MLVARCNKEVLLLRYRHLHRRLTQLVAGKFLFILPVPHEEALVVGLS